MHCGLELSGRSASTNHFKVVRIVLLVIGLIIWWVFWHTDTLFRILGFGEAIVTVRVLGDFGLSPTACIWISWAVTVWLLALIAVTFVPKVKGQLRQLQATTDGALMPAK